MDSKRVSSAVLVALLVAVGCAPSNPSIDIEGISVPSTECSFEPGDAFLLVPRLDTSAESLAVRSGIHYRAVLQLENQMLNLANNRYPLMANPNDWQATEAEVELRGIDGSPLDLGGTSARYRVPASGLIPAAAGTEPGRGMVTADVIPVEYGDLLIGRVGTIEVAVRITGTTSGDSTQQTGEYVFPLELCVGCLYQCVLDEACQEVRVDACLAGQDRVSSACIFGIPPCTPAI